jgi:hypothetical protein
MIELPQWEHGTAAVLCVSGPHAIPVSTALRAGRDRILFALAHRRETLARLRDDPAAVLCVMAPGVAFSATGTVAPVREELRASPHVAALELRVERLQDHLADGRTAIADAVRWEWTDPRAAEADAAVRAELAELART